MCAIAMGIHSGDHSIYPDCREEFRDADFKAFKLGNWGAEKVFLYTPYLEGDKFSILQDGVKCCEYLHLNFDKVYAKTNTSYKPIKHKIEFNNATETWYEEEWFSDYKSASSVERVEAFIKLGRKDPVQYADEYGPVTWEYVKEFVSCVLENYEDAKTTNI
jgi:7-cyano-7-deazaguanine synthase